MSTTAPSVVHESHGLTPEDVDDRLEAVAATYAGDLPGSGIVVADGFGCRVRVERGHLEVSDGVGQDRRLRAWSRVEAPERLIVAADGVLSTAALAWCQAAGTAVVVTSGDHVTLAASPAGRNDPRIRRQQALALDSPAGLAVVRYLLGAKLKGQAGVLRARFGATEQADTIDDLAGGIETLGAIDLPAGVDEARFLLDEARQLEAVAAAVYFGAWVGHPSTGLHFVARDRGRVPAHWGTFEGRRSSISGAANTNRLAERPLNALLNYCYRLAEVEARFACVRLGLDAGLGVLHLDAPGRDSLALDLIEALRPAVDGFVLDLIAERAFKKSDFAERADGAVRIMSPLSHELAGSLPTWRQAVGPVAEKVAHLFIAQVPGRIVASTPLTSSRAIAASAEVRRRKASEARARAEVANAAMRSSRPVRRPRAVAPARAAVALASCIDCGGALARSRHVRCEACWDHQPGQSREARRRRGAAISKSRSELDRWRAEHPQAVAHPDEFEPIRAGLQGVTLRAIMAATGASKTSATYWRSGRCLPTLRHWAALASLAGVEPAGTAQRAPSLEREEVAS